MATVIDSGTAHNLTNSTNGRDLTPDPTERRFATVVNDVGAVHTFIVDVEHIAKDVESLIKWVEHTRGTITHKSGTNEQPTHITPGEVLKLADEFLTSAGGAREQSPAQSDQHNVGGA